MEIVYTCVDPGNFRLHTANPVGEDRTEVTITMSISPDQYFAAAALMDKDRAEPVRIVLEIPGTPDCLE